MFCSVFFSSDIVEDYDAIGEGAYTPVATDERNKIGNEVEPSKGEGSIRVLTIDRGASCRREDAKPVRSEVILVEQEIQARIVTVR